MSNDELESIANKVLGKSRDGEVTTKEKLKEALPLLFALEKAERLHGEDPRNLRQDLAVLRGVRA